MPPVGSQTEDRDARFAYHPAAHERSRPVAEVQGLMPKPPMTSLPPGAAPEWDALVATKFHIPRAGFVPRPRLLARLARGIGGGLTVVCTPAGFGKTTVLGSVQVCDEPLSGSGPRNSIGGSADSMVSPEPGACLFDHGCYLAANFWRPPIGAAAFLSS